MTAELQEDMRARWRPSDRQIEQAEAMLLRGGPDAVTTTHLLVNKRWGMWTKDVEVKHLDGTFTDREEMYRHLSALVDAYCEAHEGVRVTGGYTWHRPGREWACFEF